MKRIIYRKEPSKRFFLHRYDGEQPDEERERLLKEHPTWDVYIISDDKVLSFIKEESK